MPKTQRRGGLRDGRERTYDQRLRAHAVRVLPGDMFTTQRRDEVVVTTLGSCVAACVRNPLTGFGGLNHFMLPASDTGEWCGVSAEWRYGNFAMEQLINTVLRSGCARDQLEIKIFGGGELNGTSRVGRDNARFALDYLKREGLPLQSSDVGGTFARKIHYFPSTGRVLRKAISVRDTASVIAEEKAHAVQLRTAKIEGDIELF